MIHYRQNAGDDQVARVFLLPGLVASDRPGRVFSIRGVMDETADIIEQLKEMAEKGDGLPQTYYNCTSSDVLGHFEGQTKRDFPTSTIPNLLTAVDAIGDARSSFCV